eukprot:Gb_08723 [translate_table: standard]
MLVEMEKTGYFNGFLSLKQPKSFTVDREGSWIWKGGKTRQARGALFTGKKDRKNGSLVAEKLNRFASRNGGIGSRYQGNTRLRIGQCCMKPDVAGDAVPDCKDQSNDSSNSIVGRTDSQSEASDLSLVCPTASEGLVFGMGQSDSWDSMEIGCPVVRRYLSDNEERWYMWYYGKKQGSRDSMGLAVSSNGIHWRRGSEHIETDEDVGVVMECSDDWWAFDTEIIQPSDILIMSSTKVRASTGVYWLYYSGCNSDDSKVPQAVLANPERFSENGLESSVFRCLPGLAMSHDGRNWARIEGEHHSGALFDVGAEGEWDSHSIAAPQVVFHGPDDLRMYYHSFDVKSGHFAVGIARSRDGIRWVKLGKILDGGPPGSFDELGITSRHVISNQQSNGYLMIYEGVAMDGTRSIGLAESSDGLKKWERCQNEPVFGPVSSPNAWDCKGVGSPCLVQMDDDEWRLYYQGVGMGGKTGIGLAVCTDGNLKNLRRWHGFHL